MMIRLSRPLPPSPGGDAFGDPENWEKAMSVAKYNGINLDLGHFLVGQHQAGRDPDPIPFLTKYHDHVTHVHVKDKRIKARRGRATVPFPVEGGREPRSSRFCSS